MSFGEILALAGVLMTAGGAVVGMTSATPRSSLRIQAIGVLALGVTGAYVLASGDPIGAAFHSGIHPALGLDPLSGLFLLTIALVAAPAALFAGDALGMDRQAGALAATTGAFVLSLAGFVAARDVTTLLAFWELMTLLPSLAILIHRSDAQARRGVFTYLSITHIGGAAAWVALLLLSAHGAMGGAHLTGRLAGPVAAAALIGFSTKAGLMPLHSWLPRAHPLAPAHISALMSGVMIKLPLYALIRVLFEWSAPPAMWVGIVLIAIGALSCLGGVLYALMQHELKRLLAFHSIENVGIVALGLGASLVLRDLGQPAWSALAFAAALLHTLNHALFKGLLFLGAGAFSRAVGALELDRLGGLLRQMPWTGSAFALGAVAIAGLPPLNGFASEWLTLQALLHLGITGGAGISLSGALATAALGATAALAAYCFAKVIGLVLLGLPRRAECATATEAPIGMLIAMSFLAFACMTLGALPSVLLPTLAALGPAHTEIARGAILTTPSSGSLPTLGIGIALLALTAVLLRLSKRPRAAPALAWACGQPPTPQLAWTSAGFTKPLRLALVTLLRPQREVTATTERGVLQRVSYSNDVPHLFDTLFYAPLSRAALRGAMAARRLQSGSVRAYLIYLLALLGLLLALARIGALG